MHAEGEKQANRKGTAGPTHRSRESIVFLYITCTALAAATPTGWGVVGLVLLGVVQRDFVFSGVCPSAPSFGPSGLGRPFARVLLLRLLSSSFLLQLVLSLKGFFAREEVSSSQRR